MKKNHEDKLYYEFERDQRHRLFADDIHTMSTMLQHLEEDFDRRQISQYFQNCFSAKVLSQLRSLLQLCELVLDELIGCLSKCKLDSIAHVVNKLFSIQRKGVGLMVRQFYHFYQNAMAETVKRQKTQLLDVKHLGSRKDESPIHAVYSMEQKQQVSTLANQIQQILKNKSHFAERSFSNASKELAQISKRIQFIGQVSQDLALGENESGQVDQLLLKVKSSKKMVDQITKNINDKFEVDLKNLFLNSSQKICRTLLADREQAYRSSQMEVQVQTYSIQQIYQQLQQRIEQLTEQLKAQSKNYICALTENRFIKNKNKDLVSKQQDSELKLLKMTELYQSKAAIISTQQVQTTQLKLRLSESAREITRLQSQLDAAMKLGQANALKLKSYLQRKKNDASVMTVNLKPSRNNKGTMTDEQQKVEQPNLFQQGAKSKTKGESPPTSKTEQKWAIQRDIYKRTTEKKVQSSFESQNKQKNADRSLEQKRESLLSSPILQKQRPVHKQLHKMSSNNLIKQSRGSINPKGANLVIPIEGRDSAEIYSYSSEKGEGLQPIFNCQSEIEIYETQKNEQLNSEVEQSNRAQGCQSIAASIANKLLKSSSFSWSKHQPQQTRRLAVLEIVKQAISKQNLESDLFSIPQTGNLSSVKKVSQLRQSNAGRYSLQGLRLQLRSLLLKLSKLRPFSRQQDLLSEVRLLFKGEPELVPGQEEAQKQKLDPSNIDGFLEGLVLGSRISKINSVTVQQEVQPPQPARPKVTPIVKERFHTCQDTVQLNRKASSKSVLKQSHQNLATQSKARRDQQKESQVQSYFCKQDLQLFFGLQNAYEFQVLNEGKPGKKHSRFIKQLNSGLSRKRLNDSYYLECINAKSFSTFLSKPVVIKREVKQQQQKKLTVHGCRRPLITKEHSDLDVFQFQQQLQGRLRHEAKSFYQYTRKLKDSDCFKYYFINTFLKYPYDCVFNRRLDKSSIKPQDFVKIFTRILGAHKKCGERCGHLARFYEKVGFPSL